MVLPDNFRGGDGNVGIIRSPVRAIALPDILTREESIGQMPLRVSTSQVKAIQACGCALDLRLIFVMEEASSQRCLSERKRKDGLASRWRCLQVSQEEAHDLLIGINVIFSGEPMTRKPVSHELIVFVGSLEGFG